ncbi:hypothetical protein FBU31_000853, partial [Coemansia sp. 'formosensis']
MDSDDQTILPRQPMLKGENFSFSGMTSTCYDNRYYYDELRVQDRLHWNCSAVNTLVTPCDSTLGSVSSELASKIAAELETRLSMAARHRGPRNNYCSLDLNSNAMFEGRTIDCLDVWAMDMLEWTDCPEPIASDVSQGGYDSDPYHMRAYYIAPCSDAFLLFVAHHVKVYFSEQKAAKLLNTKNCRLILPVANEKTDRLSEDIYTGGFSDYKAFAHVECGMYPLSSSVEKQVAPTSHIIVADAEIAADKCGFDGAVHRLTAKTKALFLDQHNRRFIWGLTIFSRIIRAYVFGNDDIWATAEMDVASAEGRRAFIALLVDWSLCSVDRLGFDPTIRYVQGKRVEDTYLEIDVHEKNGGTSQVEHCTYYSKRCVGAANRLTGQHSRYFVASTDLGTLDTPEFLIKDVWTTLSSDTHESSLHKVFQGAFDKPSEVNCSFSHFVSTGPVLISRGNSFVADSTAMAFAGLPNISQVREHRRT